MKRLDKVNSLINLAIQNKGIIQLGFMFNNLLDENNEPVTIPRFVWFIVIGQIINFALFGFIQLMQVRSTLNGVIIPYENIERKYIYLSFAGKLALAGALSYGLLFRTKDCP